MISLFRHSLLMIILFGILFWKCEKNDVESLPVANFGRENTTLDKKSYQSLLYVSNLKGMDKEGAGSKAKPYQSITYALSQVHDASSSKHWAILVSEGYYAENKISMRSHVDLFGGYSQEDWERDVSRHITEINGEFKDRIIIGADSARLDGFKIVDGQIRGRGAGILCDGVSPIISNNIFQRNMTLGPDPWSPKYWHKTANDGGAVYCVNEAAPIIKNNLFVGNRTENGRGAAIACQTRCQPHIYGNVFAYNITGIKDPMRSSDGGALSIFDWCSATIESNLFIGNKALSSNDGGAIFIALWSSADFRNNILIDNHTSDDAGGIFVGGQEHRYDAPLDTLPSKENFFVNIENNIFIANQNPSKNSGAMRFTMESRGRFAENLVVHNSGIYFQRSEVIVEKNIILDNFLFIETKEGLKPGIIRDNIIWADFSLQTPASVTNNNILGTYVPDGNYSQTPQFENDSVQLSVFAASFSLKNSTTDVLLTESEISEGKWVNRVVKAGNKWGIVKVNKNDKLQVWGDVSGESKLLILPSYSIKK